MFHKRLAHLLINGAELSRSRMYVTLCTLNCLQTKSGVVKLANILNFVSLFSNSTCQKKLELALSPWNKNSYLVVFLLFYEELCRNYTCKVTDNLMYPT